MANSDAAKTANQQVAAVTPQMLQHNISGNVLNLGNRQSATAPLRQAANQWGSPVAISMNESCLGQTTYMWEWLGYSTYSFVHRTQAANVPNCAANGVSGNYGVAVLATREPNGYSYTAPFQSQVAGDEARGWACLTAGLGGRKGVACSTHLQNLDTNVKRVQWGEFCDGVESLRNDTGKPVSFAGDTYETWPMLRDICANKGVNATNADQLGRPTWKNNAGQGLQVDHVAGFHTGARLKNADLLPPDGQSYPNLQFLSDHRVVVGYLDFDG